MALGSSNFYKTFYKFDMEGERGMIWENGIEKKIDTEIFSPYTDPYSLF